MMDEDNIILVETDDGNWFVMDKKTSLFAIFEQLKDAISYMEKINETIPLHTTPHS